MAGKIGSVIFVCLLSLQTAGGDSGQVWARGIRGFTNTSYPFFLELVTEESGRLVATAQYTDYRTGDESRPRRLPATIAGIHTSDGRFWPEVKEEVYDDTKKNWIPIEVQQRHGERVKITFQENNQNEWLHVDLEPFRRMISKFKYGMVTLANGEKAPFELKYLSPRAAAPGYWFRDELARVYPFDTLPFVVTAFLSKTGTDVFASCAYINKDGTSPTQLKGTRTAGGLCNSEGTGQPDFWPSVTAQVANDCNGPWKAIDPPPLPGEPFTISIEPRDTSVDLCVNVNNFRPFIGKFRYGRFVLPNGKAATFELQNLLPPEEE
jgi:hypothetical protein